MGWLARWADGALANGTGSGKVILACEAEPAGAPLRLDAAAHAVTSNPWTSPTERGAFKLWMGRLLRLAAAVGEAGEIPVAAAVLDVRGRCIGWGTNRRHRGSDPLGHAEIVALSQAARVLGDWRLHQCTLLVTLEPCPMCAGALVQARMGTVVFAAGDPKRGGLGGCLDLANHPSAHHHMRVLGGVEAQSASEQLAEWFRRRRRRDARPGP